MKTKELITFKTDDGGLTIRIPKGLLVYVAENRGEDPIKVFNDQIFLEQVAFELENNLGEQQGETGLSGFQDLIDKACYEVAMNGDVADFKD